MICNDTRNDTELSSMRQYLGIELGHTTSSSTKHQHSSPLAILQSRCPPPQTPPKKPPSPASSRPPTPPRQPTSSASHLSSTPMALPPSRPPSPSAKHTHQQATAPSVDAVQTAIPHPSRSQTATSGGQMTTMSASTGSRVYVRRAMPATTYMSTICGR